MTGNEGGFPQPVPYDCDATKNGMPVKVSFYSDMILFQGRYFNEPSLTDVKYGFAIISVDDGIMTPHGPTEVSMPGTRDLQNKSLLGGVSQGPTTVCKEDSTGSGGVICELEAGEFFTATFELIDNP